MLRIQIIGLALVAVFVMSAVAVGSASAVLPEFHGPFPNHFTALQLTTGVLETVKGRTVECNHGSALGFVKSGKDVLVNGIIYTGCKSTAFGAGKCQNAGAPKGEITTLPLLGLLGYIKASTHLVGLLLERDGGTNHFASFECEAVIKEKVTVRGTVICELSPVNVATNEYHLECKQTKGAQAVLTFEGAGTKDILETKGEGLETFGFEQSGVTALSDVFTEKLTEILA
jgi:hypothetical protein